MAKRIGQNIWDWDMRKALEFLICKEGFTPKMAAEELSVSDSTVYTELKRGMDAEEYLYKRYSKYSPENALYKEALTTYGVDELSIIFDIYIQKENEIKGNGNKDE